MRADRPPTCGSSRWAASSCLTVRRMATGLFTRSCGWAWRSRDCASPAPGMRRASGSTSTTPRAWPSWRWRPQVCRAGRRRPGPRAPSRYLVPGRGGRLMVASREVGSFGELAVPVREAFDLAAPVFVAELSLSALLTLQTWAPRYQALPRYTAVQRDLALVVPEDVTAAEIESAIRAMRLPLLTRLALFDVYTGDQIGPGRRSLAWSLTFQAPDRTLRDGEVNDLHARIVTEIAKRFKAEVRGI